MILMIRGALRRVVSAPGLIVSLALLQMLLAAWLGSATRAAVGRSMGPFSVVSEDRLVVAIIELLETHPGLIETFRSIAEGSAMFALVLWTVLAPVIILRLQAPNPSSRILAAAWRRLPDIVMTTLWCLLPRAALVAITGMATKTLIAHGSWALAGLGTTALVLAYSTCALDLARCQVTLRGASGFRAATALRAYREAWQHPAVLLPSMALSLGRWICSLAILALAIEGAGAAMTVWGIRLLAILGLVCGVSRVAVAVQASSSQPTLASADAARDNK